MGKRIAATKQTSANFGERLAALREAAGFTQVEVAAELGISQRIVAFIERGQLKRKAERRA
jgi:transcriptional regulator with XRE-family HTH domain